jgi:predicted  nucleic acid-binding Zn-ribbon protein
MEYNRKQTSLEPIDILKFDTVETGAVFKQYDINTSILELELVANGEPVHLKDEKVYVTVKSSNSLSTQLLSKYSGASVKEKDNYKVLLRAKKSRRRDVNNIIDVYISPLALENSGEMIAEVMIIDLIKEERITSQSFTFEIKPSITPNRPSESAYKLVKDLDGTYITDAEDVQLLVAEVEPNFKLSFVGTRVNEILEKANNFDVKDNTNKIQALQEKDVELESKISNLEKKDSSLDGEIASLKSSDQSIEEEIQGLKSKDESIESEISQLKSKDTAIDGEIDKLKNADETIKSDINSKYEELKQKTDATNNEVMKLKAQDTTLGESIRTNRGLIDVINPKVATLEQDSQNVKNRVSVLEGDMNLAKSNISTLQRSNTELSQKVEGVEQGNASINEILEQLQRDVERYKSSIELLESKVPVWKDFKGESFKVENSFYGKSKDLLIKGKTLQNLALSGDEYIAEWNINNVSTKNSVRTMAYGLKPNTKYTRIIEIKEIKGVSSESFLMCDSIRDNDGTYKQYQYRVNKNSNMVINTFTTGDKVTDNEYSFNPDNKLFKEGFKLVISKIMILEGDYTNNLNFEYFEGIKSLGEQEDNKISILSHGKNLLKPPLTDITKKQGICDITLTKDGEFIINGTNSTTGGGRHLFMDIYNYKLENGKTYTLSYEYVSGSSDDPNKPNILLSNLNNHSDIPASITTSSKNSVTFVANKDMTAFCGVNINVGKSYNNYKIRVQLEEGKIATPYESYRHDKKDILLNKLGFDEGLRGFDSTICDELNDIKNVAIKRIEKIVINDINISEIQDRPNAQNTNWFQTDYISNTTIKTGGLNINNKLISVTEGQAWADSNDFECLSITGTSSGARIKGRVNKGVTSEQLKERLKGLIVYYELAEPVETPLNKDINFDALDDITYVSLENNIKNELSCQCQVSLASSKA